MQIPRQIEEILRKEAYEKGIDEEILLIDKLGKELDPITRSSLYIEKAKELLAEARNYFEKKDLVQASEKAWGACASIVKAYGEKSGLEHYRHRQLEEIMSNLISKEGRRELLYGWSVCLRLHSNFYEGFMTEQDVNLSIKVVEEFVNNMEKLINQTS
ncbi:PaREP1 family protein [Saccharolobus caldissimus]|uniref:HEPN domain-containing protein n=1 Tax=Saccharolobus caldissimus TaxID=1702097 RepID=A0AAQ4CVE3_9CREN|nr:PaREP1 family protein [Saccharolobus caldissimus]BDB99774.1 hypothetical protein SACC_27910 [Saccharolobus caldissimus]